MGRLSPKQSPRYTVFSRVGPNQSIERGQIRVSKSHARQEFQTACRLNPQLSLAFQNLGLLEIQQHDYAAAEPPLHDANRLDPKDLKTLTLLAYAEAPNKKYEDAILTARRVHDFNDHAPVYAYAHMIAATALESCGKPDEAIKEYQQFLSEAPKDARANIARQQLRQLGATTPK